MDIYLIRHPKVRLDAGICYGWANVELPREYSTDLQALREKKIEWEGVSCISSPLQRCLLVARHFSRSAVEVRDELRELHFGDWELQPWDAIEPAALRAWTDDFVSARCPNGESYRDLHRRVSAFWSELLARDSGRVAVFTHAGVIRSILATILRIPLESSFALRVDPNSVTGIRSEAGYQTVEYVNH